MSSVNLNAFRRLATVEHLVDGVMVTFAMASVGNISEFMRSHGHNVVTAYGVGVALGLGLVAVAVMLARTPTDDRQAFYSMLAATVAVGLLSGTVQALAYYDHTANPYTAALQGYGFPLIGECLLALAMAFYTAGQKRRLASMADEHMEQRINDALNSALTNIDVSSASRYIERQAAAILRAKMDSIVAKRLGHVSTAESAVSHQTGGFGPDNLPAANEERQRLVEDRRAAIVELFGSFGQMNVTALRSRLQDDRGIAASENTIRADLAALVDAGNIAKCGRGQWATGDVAG